MLRLAAPAKLNLFLHVVARRPDGYHELQTVFQFLDLSDRIELAVRGDGSIRRVRGSARVPEADDLAVRAARLLQAESGCSLGADLAVDKHIPEGAGLGGGSSDAAAVLVGLDRLWGLDAGEDALAALGLRLGADVPVFVRGRAAWAEGVGERLIPVELDEPWYLVVLPPVEVSTATVFGAGALTRDTPPVRISALSPGRGRSGAPRLATRDLIARARNDCEPVVRSRFPEVAAALDWLSARAVARMTGTGAAVFTACEHEAEARDLAEALPAGWRAVIARGLCRSPLVA